MDSKNSLIRARNMDPQRPWLRLGCSSESCSWPRHFSEHPLIRCANRVPQVPLVLFKDRCQLPWRICSSCSTRCADRRDCVYCAAHRLPILTVQRRKETSAEPVPSMPSLCSRRALSQTLGGILTDGCDSASGPGTRNATVPINGFVLPCRQTCPCMASAKVGSIQRAVAMETVNAMRANKMRRLTWTICKNLRF